MRHEGRKSLYEELFLAQKCLPGLRRESFSKSCAPYRSQAIMLKFLRPYKSNPSCRQATCDLKHRIRDRGHPWHKEIPEHHDQDEPIGLISWKGPKRNVRLSSKRHQLTVNIFWAFLRSRCYNGWLFLRREQASSLQPASFKFLNLETQSGLGSHCVSKLHWYSASLIGLKVQGHKSE